MINIGIIVTYSMVAFATLATIGFGVKKMLQNTENAKKTIYTIIGLIVILIIAYLLLLKISSIPVHFTYYNL